MADVPHRGWFEFIHSRLPTSDAPLADLFCGPGYIAAAARAAGIAAVAVDRHRPFLKRESGICADALELPFGANCLSALTATNASLNYFLNTDVLTRHLVECRRVLADNGVYVFDVCTEERAQSLAGSTMQALDGKVRFAHKYESPLRRLTTTVVIAGKAEVEEVHVQQIFSPEEIEAAARAAGFRVTEMIANYALPTKGNSYPIMTWVLQPSEHRP